MKKPKAVLMIRSNVKYRLDVFTEALEHLGYEIVQHPPLTPQPDDILLIWNRYSSSDKAAQLFEKHGCAVICVENSYLNMRGSKKSFAMALNRHNGGGLWPVSEYPRLPLLDIDLKPWKKDGKVILVLPQRGIGTAPVAMPKNWVSSIEKKIKARTDRPYYIRLHPGIFSKKRPGTSVEAHPLERDIESAWCCVTWASSAATKALVAGVPCFYEFKSWVAGPGAYYGVSPLAHVEKSAVWSLMGDREAMLERLAWAQWTGEEVRCGDPIKRLVELHAALKNYGEAGNHKPPCFCGGLK